MTTVRQAITPEASRLISIKAPGLAAAVPVSNQSHREAFVSSTTLSGFYAPTVEVIERSDGHFLPFIVAVVLFLVSAIASIGIAGLPQ
jgi:hypothetical protein